MKSLFTIILLVSTNIIFSQEISFKVDSVSVYYIPWDYHPRFSFSKGDLLAGEYHYKSFTDSIVIESLLKSNLFDKELSFDDYYIDARMLIRIYFKSHFSDVLINPFGYYSFEDSYFRRNNNLIKWINNNVTIME
jgi:hypothetical protein